MLFLTFISWCAVRQSRPLCSDLVTSCCFKSDCGYFCQAVVILWGSVFTLELLLVTFCTLTHFVGFEVFCWGSRSLALCGFLCFTLMFFYVILFIFSVQRDTNSSKWQKTKFKITRNMPKDLKPTHVSEHSFFLQGFPAQAATSQLAGSPAERCDRELPVVARWESLQRCFWDSEQLEPEAGSWPGPWPGLVQEQPWWSGLSGWVLVAAQQHWAGGEPRLHVRWVTDSLKGEYAQINLDNDEQWFFFSFRLHWGHDSSRQRSPASKSPDPRGDLLWDLSVKGAFHPVAGQPLRSPASFTFLHQHLLLSGVTWAHRWAAGSLMSEACRDS